MEWRAWGPASRSVEFHLERKTAAQERKRNGVQRLMSRRPKVIIIGGGFGGLRAAQALKHAPVDVTLIDKRNYHLFQPLLYQVATGSLSPGEIAAPLRGVLSHQKNTQVLLGEATDIDLGGKKVIRRDGTAY